VAPKIFKIAMTSQNGPSNFSKFVDWSLFFNFDDFFYKRT